MVRKEYLRCPYPDCPSRNFVKMRNKKRPKSLGLFRIMELGLAVHVFQCQKCLKIFRARIFGTFLLWSDLTSAEKAVFKKQKWVKYDKGVKP